MAFINYINNSNHPIKIGGRKNFILSATVYIDYLQYVFKGFDEKYGIANKFTDLCCKKDKDGNLIRDDEKMDKIYYGYLAKNINLVYSKDKKDKIDKIIQNIKAAINSDVCHNLLYINCDNQDVIKLIESVDNIDVRFLKAIDGLTDEKQINDKSKKIIDFMNAKIDLISKKIDMNNKELISAVKKAEIRQKKVTGDLSNTGWINTLAKRSISHWDRLKQL